MTSKDRIQQYRYCYSLLLRLYSNPYYERFGRGMEQTFNDLLHERVGQKRGVLIWAIWVYIETTIEILKENVMTNTILSIQIMRVFLVSTGLLLVPCTASFFLDGWHWDLGDYMAAWVLFAVTGLVYSFVTNNTNNIMYKTAVGLAVTGALFLVWSNLAVGIIGDDNPANLLYFGMILTGLICACMVRFQPHGMSRILYAMALAQMMVPLIALICWSSNFSPGVIIVFTLNAVFASVWIGSALLFRRAVIDSELV